MEFKPQGLKSKIIATGEQTFVTRIDIDHMLKNEYLHDQHSHFIVSSEGVYDDSRMFQYGMATDRIEHLVRSYENGHTIVIKDLESWNDVFKENALKLAPFTNAHLYLSPPGATRFGWHEDDRDVFVKLQIGEKKFEIKEVDGSISEYLLKVGDCLFIPYGLTHRASATDKASVHVSFGKWPDNLNITNTYSIIDIPLTINLDRT